MRAGIGPYTRGNRRRIIRITTHRYDHWSAYNTIALVTVPVLKRLRACNIGHPACLESEQWEQYLDQMIWSLEQCIEDDEPMYGDTEAEQDAYWAWNDLVQEGLDLFGMFFRHLWD